MPVFRVLAAPRSGRASNGRVRGLGAGRAVAGDGGGGGVRGNEGILVDVLLARL
jgi:hypothetical protein